MVNKILFWTGFGLAVRFWQLGLEMRPFFHAQSLWVYPFYGAIGGTFGYWMMGVSDRQRRSLEDQRFTLLQKRKRRDEFEKKKERERAEAIANGEAVAVEERERDRGYLIGRN